MKALQEEIGPVGMVKFMQQYDMGDGDYTKEKQEQPPDMSLKEIDMLLKNDKTLFFKQSRCIIIIGG